VRVIKAISRSSYSSSVTCLVRIQ